MTETFDSVETHGLQATVAQHLGHLSVLLAVLFEDLNAKKTQLILVYRNGVIQLNK